jgi:hypothetical protein
MANEEHLKILEQGIEAWNRWRQANPQVVEPDIRNANLSGTQLYGANLTGARLDRANLNRSNLTAADLALADLGAAELIGADLRRANLGQANLRDACLNGADLYAADFRKADLTRARLVHANLGGARFGMANLNDADLTGSVLGRTELNDLDLSVVKGLDTIRHIEPSTIGVDTIYNSRGNIPEAFLRGAGIPDVFIINMKALVMAMEPIQFYSCFISYSSKDHEFTERLHADLQSKGVRCWFAQEDLKIGDPFRKRIDDAIRMHDKLLIVLSSNSASSSWVEKEVETAFEKERQQNRIVLFPIRLDDAVMETREAWAADIRRTRHIGDFSAWKDHDLYKKAFDRLMRDLRAEEKVESVAQR